jgi:hypothetical protein
MKINYDLSLSQFEAWSGATRTKDIIMENHLEIEFENLINELYPDGIDATTLNDILWFEDQWIFEVLNIEIEE